MGTGGFSLHRIPPPLLSPSGLWTLKPVSFSLYLYFLSCFLLSSCHACAALPAPACLCLPLHLSFPFSPSVCLHFPSFFCMHAFSYLFTFALYTIFIFLACHACLTRALPSYFAHTCAFCLCCCVCIFSIYSPPLVSSEQGL